MPFEIESHFYEMAIILAIATALGFFGQKLRQPLLIMFMATGIVAGPSVLGIISSHDQVELLAQIGIAVTAMNEGEAEAFKKAGADVVLQPLVDAAEQAVDGLTQAIDVIPVGMEWPLGFREIRIKSNSAHAGCTLLEIPLPTNGGVSILAVSRGGRVHYEPGPDFRVFPSDRLVLMGPPETLAETEAVLNQASGDEGDQLAQRFEATEVLVPPGAAEIGKSLAELKFRDTYGVTVVGIARNTERIFPGPEEVLQARDVLVVIGLSDAVQRFKQQPWL